MVTAPQPPTTGLSVEIISLISRLGLPTAQLVGAAHQVCTRHASKCKMSRCSVMNSVMPMMTLKPDSYRMYAVGILVGIEHPCQTGPCRLLPSDGELSISSDIFPRRVDYWSCSHVLYQSPPPADNGSVNGLYSGFTEGRFRKKIIKNSPLGLLSPFFH